LKLGIRAKLFIISVGVILTSGLVAHLYLRAQLERTTAARIRDNLAIRAELVGMRASQSRAALDDIPAWQALAVELGKRAQARVTLIRKDGVVLGDSEVALERVRRLENHAGREEVREALASGRGQSERSSATLARRMHYSAVVLRRDGEPIGVARVAMAMTEVDTAVARLWQLLTIATAIAAVIAVATSMLAVQLFSRRALTLVATARKLAEGDLEARSGLAADDEFGELGTALDQLAGSLADSVQQLRNERDQLGGILAGMEEGVLLLDRNGSIGLVNPALRGMLGFDEGAEGRQPEEVVSHEGLLRLLTAARASEAPVSEEIELPGSSPRILLVRAAPLRGAPGGVFCVFVDFTEIRRLERLRRDFVANASHELRTPVTSIRSATETLTTVIQKDPQAVTMFVEIIDRNAARLHSLVEDLLDLSRAESREFDLHLERIELDRAFSRVIQLFRERAAKKNIRLLQHRSVSGLEVLADEVALENVLSNLVDNAVKYAGPDVEVRLIAAREGDRVRVSVQDTGPGIEAKHLPRLFERFYRVDAGRSRELGGTGLGLSIVKHLVEVQGGRIQVESTPGQGTTFSFTLPREDSSSQAAAPASDPTD
jgi:two-component system phosphate regulon sensor histidine kinase PhoR